MARFVIPGLNKYTFRGEFLSVRLAIQLFGASIIAGTVFYYFLEEYSISEAFYMAVITFSTVGYGEVRPLDQAGQIFTSIYVILNIAIYAYAITAFTSSVVKGEIFKTMHQNLISKKINKLKNHVILCGYGKYGEEITHHFIVHKILFVIIERNHSKIENIQKSQEKLLYIEGDATHDEVLMSAGLLRARSLISALADDTDNLFTVLTARQMNPKIDIISRASDPKTERKLVKAGANHVIMPEVIGGFHIATLVTNPGAVEFFAFLSDQYESDVGFKILSYESVPENCKNKSIGELRIREKTGVNIIGLKLQNGKYVVNPDPKSTLIPGTSFIVLGTEGQLEKLYNYLENY